MIIEVRAIKTIETSVIGFRSLLKDGYAKCTTLVHLILLRKQRLMKHCVLLRIAWSQKGHVMCANPVHLEHLRVQRLMNNSAMSPFYEEAANGRRKHICNKKIV